MVLPAFDVVGKDPLEGRTTIVRSGSGVRASEMIVEVIPHGSPEPFVDRHTETHFGPFQNGARQKTLHCFTQQPFGCCATHAIAIRQGRHQRREFVIGMGLQARIVHRRDGWQLAERIAVLLGLADMRQSIAMRKCPNLSRADLSRLMRLIGFGVCSMMLVTTPSPRQRDVRLACAPRSRLFAAQRMSFDSRRKGARRP